MALPSATVTGHITDSDGNAVADAICIFRLTRPDMDDGVVVPEKEETRTDSNGDFAIDLWPNTEGETNSRYHVLIRDPSNGDTVVDSYMVVPSGGGTLTDLLDLEHNPEPVATWKSVALAQENATLAERWASEAVGTTVVNPVTGQDTGEYSAKHYAEQYRLRGLKYEGTWDASTGSFPSPAETAEWYTVSTTGTVGGVTYRAGDAILYNGGDATLSSGWDHQRNSVYTVAGKTGDVTLAAVDIASGTFADARIAQSNVTQHQGAIDHDALTNFVANEHVDHSAVTLTAGNGLTGGGDLTASRSFAIAAGAIQIDELDLSIAPTWTRVHTFAAGLDAGGANITSVADASASTDAVNFRQLNAVEQGRTHKESVRAATDGANVDLTSTTDPNPIDGVTLADGDRVLLKDQTDGTENGIYNAVTATDPTTWARSADADEDSEVTSGMAVAATEGTANAEVLFLLTTDSPTLGTDALTFTGFNLAALTAGAGLSKTNQTVDLDVPSLPSLGASPATGDILPVYDSSAGSHQEISVSELAGAIDHTMLSTPQGGTTGEYYHLTSAQHTSVGNIVSAGHAEAMDQGVAMGDTPTFAGGTFTGTVTLNGTTQIMSDGWAGLQIHSDENATDGGPYEWRLISKFGSFALRDEAQAVERLDVDASGNVGVLSGNLYEQGSRVYSPNNNPTKADVGLGNVPNVDATDASNIDSGTLADGRVAQSNVTQHETALTITESQISDLKDYALKEVTWNFQIGTSYTLALSDSGGLVEMDNSSANTVTVPANSTVSFPVGTEVSVVQYGGGTTSIAAASGVTIRTPETLDLRKQYSMVSLVKRGTDEWVLTGDVAAA